MQIIEYPLEYWRSGGVLLIPLALVCFGIWFYFLRTRRSLLFETANARMIVAGLHHNDLKGLQKATGAIVEFVRKVLLMDGRSGDVADLFDEGSARLTDMLKRDIIILAALTTIAPLLGLMGTVVGMIQTFDAVATTSTETTARVASGVGRALITTQVGMMIAIPGVFGLARLRCLANHLQVQLGAIKLHAVLLRDI